MVEISMQNWTIGAEANQIVIKGLNVGLIQDYKRTF